MLARGKQSGSCLCLSIGPVAQWIRHRPTEPGIAGSSPAGVIFRARAETWLGHFVLPIKPQRVAKAPGRKKRTPAWLHDPGIEVASEH